MATQTFEWHPARLLQSDEEKQDFALLVLNQPLKNGANLRKLWQRCTSRVRLLLTMRRNADGSQASIRVAADGGANQLYELSTFHGKFVSFTLSPLLKCAAHLIQNDSPTCRQSLATWTLSHQQSESFTHHSHSRRRSSKTRIRRAQTLARPSTGFAKMAQQTLSL